MHKKVNALLSTSLAWPAWAGDSWAELFSQAGTNFSAQPCSTQEAPLALFPLVPLWDHSQKFWKVVKKEFKRRVISENLNQCQISHLLCPNSTSDSPYSTVDSVLLIFWTNLAFPYVFHDSSKIFFLFLEAINTVLTSEKTIF